MRKNGDGRAGADVSCVVALVLAGSGVAAGGHHVFGGWDGMALGGLRGWGTLEGAIPGGQARPAPARPTPMRFRAPSPLAAAPKPLRDQHAGDAACRCLSQRPGVTHRPSAQPPARPSRGHHHATPRYVSRLRLFHGGVLRASGASLHLLCTCRGRPDCRDCWRSSPHARHARIASRLV